MYWMDLLNVCAVLYLIGLGLSRGCRWNCSDCRRCLNCLLYTGVRGLGEDCDYIRVDRGNVVELGMLGVVLLVSRGLILKLCWMFGVILCCWLARIWFGSLLIAFGALVQWRDVLMLRLQLVLVEIAQYNNTNNLCLLRTWWKLRLVQAGLCFCFDIGFCIDRLILDRNCVVWADAGWTKFWWFERVSPAWCAIGIWLLGPYGSWLLLFVLIESRWIDSRLRLSLGCPGCLARFAIGYVFLNYDVFVLCWCVSFDHVFGTSLGASSLPFLFSRVMDRAFGLWLLLVTQLSLDCGRAWNTCSLNIFGLSVRLFCLALCCTSIWLYCDGLRLMVLVIL